MAKIPDPNVDTQTTRSEKANDRLEDIGRILSRRAEIKGVQDSAMFKNLESVFNQFAEDVKDESGSALKGASEKQLESFNILKTLLIDMRKDNGENLEKYRQEVSKLMGKISTIEGPEKNRVFLQTQAQNILEQTDKPVKTKGQKFGQAIADKFGMKDLSVKSFFNFSDAFEKESVLGKTFDKPESSSKDSLEMANLEGQLEGITQKPRKRREKDSPTYSAFGRRRSFVGAFANDEQNAGANGSTFAPKESQVSRKDSPSTSPNNLKLSVLNVDRVIAKSLDVEKPAKSKKALPERDEKGRFIKKDPTSNVLKKDVAGDDLAYKEEKAQPGSDSGGDTGFLDKIKKLLSKGGAGEAAAAGAAGSAALTAATIGTVALGGAAATGAATGLLATPMQEENRKALRENSMLGAVSGDTAMAGAILDANGEQSPEEINAQQAKEKESLKDAPWYTRMYGIGKSKYLSEKTGDSEAVTGKQTLVNAAPAMIKKDEAELSAMASKPQQPVVIQAPAAQAPQQSQSIVMPIKGNVRPNESALEKYQKGTFTR